MKIINKTSGKVSYVRTLLPTLLTIALFIIAIFIVVIPQFENIILDRKREMIRELTNSTISMINRWYQLQLSGSISEMNAKKNVIDLIKNLRYGEELKDYFWVTDLHPRMIVHPYRPDLDGTDLTGFQDLKDKKLFVEMVNVVQKFGEGYVDYMWQWKDDSTRIVPKLSYVKKFEPWNWVIGTGIYVEDVRLEIKRLEQKIITISIIITILSSMLLSYIAFRNIKNERLRKIAEEELKESREKYRMLVEASGEGLIMILDNRQTFYNKTFYKMLGYSENDNEFELTKIFWSIPNSNVYDFSNLIRKTSDSDFNEQIETRFIKKNGELINVLLNISPISFMNNNGIVINVKDLSIHEEMREALYNTREKYISLINQISLGVFRATFDSRGELTEVNSTFIQLLGLENEEEGTVRSLFEFFDNDDDITSLTNALTKDGFIKNKIVTLHKQNGSKFTVSLSAVIVKGIKDDNQFIDGIIEDITEMQRTDKGREKLLSDLLTSVAVLSQKITPYVKELPYCDMKSSVFDVAKKMTEKKCNSILVKESGNEELGIITDQDIIDKVITAGRDLNIPADGIMTTPIYSIKSSASIYDALAILREMRVRHLIVKDAGGKIIGILDMDDLFDVSYSSFLFFIEKIENASDVKMLLDYRNQLVYLISGMINNNVDVRSCFKMISLVADSITRKVINLAIKEHGDPPCSFAFISMGSEGREEQTLLTDQDNAIIYEDPSPQNSDEVHQYFLKLGTSISDYLNSCGYSYCKGNIMASNPKWCQPITVWKKYFTKWITEANPLDLLDIKIFFDFRFIYGESELFSMLQGHINKLVGSSSNLLLYLSDNVIRAELPDTTIKMKSPIDLKLTLLPVIDFARLYGLKYNLCSSNTIDRIEYIHDQGVISDSFFKNILIYYNFLMNLRLRHQSEKYSEKRNIDNFINPKNLTDVQILIFKKYLDLLKELKDKISIDFKGTLMR